MSVPRGNVLKCDQKDLTKGWYRFMDQAGSQIAAKCVPKHHCGTHAPGWMQGSHPTRAQGLVTRKVCYHWNNNCCQWSNNIRVRNCGGFYVYELDKTPVCHLRYCGNGGPGMLAKNVFIQWPVHVVLFCIYFTIGGSSARDEGPREQSTIL